MAEMRPEKIGSSVTRSTFLANVISRITNPCILSVLLLLLIAVFESGSLRELFGSVMIVLLFLVLLPLFYVYMRTVRNRSGEKFVAVPTVFLKQHPKDILVLGLIMGLPCIGILVLLDAPALMIATLVALLASSIVVALFNIFYRVSYHLAAITVLVIMAAIAWGPVLLVLLVGIPVIAWAKCRINEHTPAQISIGITIALIFSGAILYFLH